jgi:hypothetical protein
MFYVMSDPTTYQEAYIGQIRSLVRQSPVRRKILLLLIKNGSLTITQLQKELEKRGDKYDYRTIWQHCMTLQELSVTMSNKDDHKPGKPVIVSLNTIIRRNKDRIKKALLEDYPHYPIPQEEKKKYG